MGFGVLLLFGAIILVALAVKGKYKELTPFKGVEEVRPPGMNEHTQSTLTDAINLAKGLNPS